MTKKIVGITTSISKRKEKNGYYSLDLVACENAFVEAVWQAGGLPIMLPIVKDLKQARQLMNHIQALIVIGGNDVNPFLYNEQPHPKLAEYIPERDNGDLALIEAANEAALPILGICRGAQLLNVYKGGSLYQDLESQYENFTIQHLQKSLPNIGTHTIQTVAGSVMADLLGDEEIFVNSFHHQAVKVLGRDLMASAYSRDGLIEAIESKKAGEKILGVQWHPEALVHDYPIQRRLFSWLIDSMHSSSKD